MTTEREAARVVREWMQEPTELDDRGLARVLEQLPDTPQRRHRWLRPLDWRPFGPGATRSAGPGGATLRWRNPNMLNATRLVAAIAIIAVSGSLALQVGPQVASGPAAPENAAGSIWLERDSDGLPTYYVLHGDGIAVGFSQEFGIGLGEWAPLDDRSLSAELGFTGIDAPLYSYVHLEPGTADLRFTAELDEVGDRMTLTYDENDVGFSTSTAERKKMAPMPPEAEVVTPPDPGWQPEVGIYSHGPDESNVTIERYGGRPNQALEHSDGTWVSINSWVGPGVGLMAEPDEYHGIMTAWFTEDDPDDPDLLPLVGMVSIDPETGAMTNRYGDSNGFYDSAPMASQAEPEVAEVDPAWWPSLGSLWVEEREDGPSVTTAIHADGTILTIDPYRGVGVGNWTPTGPDSASVVIDYYDMDPTLDGITRGDSTLLGELQMDEAHENATIDFTDENELTNDPDAEDQNGSATLKRQPLEG